MKQGRSIKTDVAIVGGGLAGFMAALGAASRGRSAVVIDERPGASYLHSGVFDIDADPSRVRDIAALDAASMGRNLELLAIASPAHPYSRLGGREAESALRAAMKEFCRALDSSCLKISGDPMDRMLLMSNTGTMKRARLAMAGIASGAIREPEKMKVAFVGICGMPAFNAANAAERASAVVKRATGRGFAATASAMVELPGCENYSNIAPARAAEILDDQERAEIFAGRAADAIAGADCDRAAFPAILGLRKHAETFAAVERRLGIKIFELASTPPSVPGARLRAAMDAALAKAGVAIVRGRAAGLTSEDGRLAGLDVVTKHEELIKIEASEYALATGKFIGGGIRHDEIVREALFGLPVFSGDTALDSDDAPMTLLSADINGKQPLFECGLKIDSSLRALDAEGSPVFENLRCAGSVIGGYDAQRDGCGSGVALLTGWLAGSL